MIWVRRSEMFRQIPTILPFEKERIMEKNRKEIRNKEVFRLLEMQSAQGAKEIPITASAITVESLE